MSATLVQATDLMFSRIKHVIDNDVAAILGYIPETRWPYVAEPSKPNSAKIWLRVSSQVVMEGQSTLSTCVGAPGKKRYQTAGLIFIEAYIPKTTKDTTSIRLTASALRNAFRNAPSGEYGIRYYNARVNDGIPPEELFYRFNVVTEYEYDEEF